MTKIKTLNIATSLFLILIVGFILFWTSNKPEVINTEFVTTNQESQISPKVKNTTLKDSIVAYGMEYLETPYVTAGCSENGFDCSGFVYFVFQHFDIKTPRSSAAFEDFGKEIPIDLVEKGDVLLFLSPTRNEIGHIGIVSKADGMKSDFIHASSGREMQVIVTNLTNKGYTQRFVKAIRVLD